MTKFKCTFCGTEYHNDTFNGCCMFCHRGLEEIRALANKEIEPYPKTFLAAVDKAKNGDKSCLVKGYSHNGKIYIDEVEFEDDMKEEKEEYMIKKQKLFECKTCGDSGYIDTDGGLATCGYCNKEEKEEYNLTLGQAIDLLLKGKLIECDIKERKNEYLIFHMGDFCWKDKNTDTFDGTQLGVNSGFSYCKFKEYKPESKPPKLVKWYRPLNVWEEGLAFPQPSKVNRFYRSKDKFDGMKVLEWEEKLFPRTFEECE